MGGTFRIVAAFGGVLIDPNVTAVDVSVLANGAELFARELSGVGAGATFDGQQTLTPGDRLDFHLGQGANNTILNDSTAIDVRISLCPEILGQPGPAVACRAGSATFEIVNISCSMEYEWTASPCGLVFTSISDGLNEACGRRFTASGARTPILTITGPFDGEAWNQPLQVRCVVTSPCASVTSNPATLTVCVADTDDGSGAGTCDGGVDISDLLYYLLLFDGGDLDADLDDGSSTGTPDGGVDISDLLYFLLRFDQGC